MKSTAAGRLADGLPAEAGRGAVPHRAAGEPDRARSPARGRTAAGMPSGDPDTGSRRTPGGPRLIRRSGMWANGSARRGAGPNVPSPQADGRARRAAPLPPPAGCSANASVCNGTEPVEPSARNTILTTSFLTATTLVYAVGAGITAAAGTRLALQWVLVALFTGRSFRSRGLG